MHLMKWGITIMIEYWSFLFELDDWYLSGRGNKDDVLVVCG